MIDFTKKIQRSGMLTVLRTADLSAVSIISGRCLKKLIILK